MQQGGDDGGVIHLLFGQYHGDSDRMGKVRLARLAELAVVHGLAEIIGLTDQALI